MMNEDLLNAFSALLDEKLDQKLEEKLNEKFEPMNLGIHRLEEKMGQLEGRFDHFEGGFERLEVKVDHLESRFEQLDVKVDRIKGKLDQLASEDQADVMAVLHIMNKKLDDMKHDVEFTYEKTSMNELEINRLKHQ